MKELVLENMKRAKELTMIILKFRERIGNAYIELLNDLNEYGKDSKNVDLYNAAGYTLMVKTEFDALYSTEKTINNLLENFYR